MMKRAATPTSVAGIRLRLWFNSTYPFLANRPAFWKSLAKTLLAMVLTSINDDRLNQSRHFQLVRPLAVYARKRRSSRQVGMSENAALKR